MFRVLRGGCLLFFVAVFLVRVSDRLTFCWFHVFFQRILAAVHHVCLRRGLRRLGFLRPLVFVLEGWF